MADIETLKPIIEALIYASDSPLTFERLSSVLEGEGKADIKAALNSLMDDYKSRSGGIFIEEVAGGYSLRTNQDLAPWIRRLYKIGLQKISKASMESLAIIAYKQPVTRAELEAVRGVDSGGVLSTLMEKRFIKITGKKEIPGRPVVYGTTKEFLETFDLGDLSCLPSLKDIQKTEENDAAQATLFTSAPTDAQAAPFTDVSTKDTAGNIDTKTAPFTDVSTEDTAGNIDTKTAPFTDVSTKDKAGNIDTKTAPFTDVSTKDKAGNADAQAAPFIGVSTHDKAGNADIQATVAEVAAADRQAPEDNSRRRDNIKEEGRGVDSSGTGYGEPADDNGIGGKG